VIGESDIIAFLAERCPKGVTISCENPEYLPAAEKLSAAIAKAFGTPARITRTSPRIWGAHVGLGVWRSERHTEIEEPDVLLGNRDDSHYIASLAVSPGFNGHCARLPIMSSGTFPGPGRCAVTLLRPWTKRNFKPEDPPDRAFFEMPAPGKLVIGASDVDGLDKAVDAMGKLVKKAR